MRKYFLLILSLLVAYSVSANKFTANNNADLTTALTVVATGDTIILGNASYSNFNIPSGKNITIMALDTAKATFTGQFGFPSSVAAGTSIVFQGLNFNGGGSTSNGKYFFNSAFVGKIDSLVFRNCNLQGYTRCLLALNNCNPNLSGISKVNIVNSVLCDFSSATYNMIWSSAPIDTIRFVNNTIYNSMTGAKPESFFSPKTAPTDPHSVNLIFKNNTYYSGSRTDKGAFSYPMFNFGTFYAGDYSKVDISDNIIYCPATGFNPNYILKISAGWFEGSINNNLIIGHAGDTIAAPADYQNIVFNNNYLSLDTLGLSNVSEVFADASNGNFTIYTAFSPLADKSSTGGCLGSSRWANATKDLCKLITGISPTSNQDAGKISGPKGIIQKGSQVSLTATKNFGFKFVKWTDDKGTMLSDSTTYIFSIDKDMTVYAVFDSVPVYKLTMNIVGGDGSCTYSQAGKDGKYEYYEEGTELTIKAEETPIFTFLAWWTDYAAGQGYQAGNPLTVKMDKDVTLYLEYESESYICGWNFPKTGNANAISAYYTGKYTDQENKPTMSMYYTYNDINSGHTPFSTWWAGKDGYNSVTPWKYYTNTGSSSNDTTPTRLKGEAYYLETVLNTTHYKDICVNYALGYSYYGYDNFLLQIKYKEEGSWETVKSHTISSAYTTFRDTIENSGKKSTLYLRIMPDVTSNAHNNIKDVDGTLYRDIYILAMPDPSSVNKISDENTVVYVSNGCVNIETSGLKKVLMYSVDGRLVKETDINGSTSIPLNKRGLYLVKVGNSVTKVLY